MEEKKMSKDLRTIDLSDPYWAEYPQQLFRALYAEKAGLYCKLSDISQATTADDPEAVLDLNRAVEALILMVSNAGGNHAALFVEEER
jgi:hypothetical protein